MEQRVRAAARIERFAKSSKMHAGLEFMRKIGIEHYCFHDIVRPPWTDLKPATPEEYGKRTLRQIVAYKLPEAVDETGIKPLRRGHGTFGHAHSHANGAKATNLDSRRRGSRSHAADQERQSTPRSSGGENQFWRMRAGMSAAHTDMGAKRSTYGQPMLRAWPADAHPGFKGNLLIEPKVRWSR